MSLQRNQLVLKKGTRMCDHWHLVLTVVPYLAVLGPLPRPVLAQSEDTPSQTSSVQPESQVAGGVSLDLNNDIASYASRITGAWSTALDAAAVNALFTDQQRWRRRLPRSSSNRPGRGGTPLSTLDCQPTFVASISRRPWPFLTTETTTIALCFSVCMDHPSCTSTVPLIRRPVPAATAPTTNPTSPQQQPGSSGGAEYHLLLRCGLTALWRGMAESGAAEGELGSDTPAEIRGTAAAGTTSKPICRNVVDAAAGQPGVRVETAAVPSLATGKAGGVSTKGYTRVTDRQYDEELILTGHDLWSHWRLQPLLFVQPPQQSANPRARTQALVLPLGAFPGLYQPAEALLAQAASRGTVVTRGQPGVLTGAWVASPDAQGGMQATYVVQRPDMGDRWYAFSTVKKGAGPDSAWSLFADGVNGPCQEVVQQLWSSAAAWNASTLASDIPKVCLLSERSTAAQQGSSALEMARRGWANSGVLPLAYLNYTTRIYSPAARLAAATQQGLLCPLLLQQQLSNITQTLFIQGCDKDTANPLLVYADTWRKAHCRGQRLITTPAVEVRYGAGHLVDTYRTAWAAWSLFRELPEGTKSNFTVDGDPQQEPAAAGQPRSEEYYTTVNAALQYNTTDLERILQQQLVRAVEGLVAARPRAGSGALSSGDVVNAFTVLTIAYLNVFRAWPPVTKKHAIIVLDMLLRWCPGIGNIRWVQAAWLGFSRAVSMGIVTGVPLYGFYAVVYRRQGRFMAGDSPRVTYIPVVGQPPCSSPARTPAAVVVTSTMWYEEEAEWGLVTGVMSVVVGTIVLILLAYVVRVMRRKNAVEFPYNRERHLWGMVERFGFRTASALGLKWRQQPTAPTATAAAAAAAPPAAAAVAAVTATAMLLLTLVQASPAAGSPGTTSSSSSSSSSSGSRHSSGAVPSLPGKGPACRRRDAAGGKDQGKGPDNV